MRATVLVRPKRGLLDPQGEAVERSLRQLGFEVNGARVGRVIDLELGAIEPEQAQAELVQVGLDIEAEISRGVYRLSNSERTGIERGLTALREGN